MRRLVVLLLLVVSFAQAQYPDRTFRNVIADTVKNPVELLFSSPNFSLNNFSLSMSPGLMTTSGKTFSISQSWDGGMDDISPIGIYFNVTYANSMNEPRLMRLAYLGSPIFDVGVTGALQLFGQGSSITLSRIYFDDATNLSSGAVVPLNNSSMIKPGNGRTTSSVWVSNFPGDEITIPHGLFRVNRFGLNSYQSGDDIAAAFFTHTDTNTTADNVSVSGLRSEAYTYVGTAAKARSLIGTKSYAFHWSYGHVPYLFGNVANVSIGYSGQAYGGTDTAANFLASTPGLTYSSPDSMPVDIGVWIQPRVGKNKYGVFQTGIADTNLLCGITKFSGPIIPQEPLALSGTSVDWSSNSQFTKTLGENTTFTFNNMVNGKTIVVYVTNTASNWTVTWPSCKWKGGSQPAQTNGATMDLWIFTKVNSDIVASQDPDYH
jgi:hypothetical protein